MSDILTGTPADLTYANEMVRHAWMVVWAITSGALGGHPRLDGAELHRVRAPGDPSGGLAGNGAAPRARPGGRRIVALVGAP